MPAGRFAHKGLRVPGPGHYGCGRRRRSFSAAALSVSGADEVCSVIDILRPELEGAMAMTGRTRVDEIDRSVFR